MLARILAVAITLSQSVVMFFRSFFIRFFGNKTVQKLHKVMTTENVPYIHWRDWNDWKHWLPYTESKRSAPRYKLHYVHRGHIDRKAA